MKAKPHPFYYDAADRRSFGFWLGWDPKSAFSIFAKSYRQAAERLTKSLLRRNRFSDYEAYPVVFLYRHALELELKHAIYKAAEYADCLDTAGVEGKLQNHHDLPELAKIVQTSLTLLFPGDEFSGKLLKRLDATCRDLAKIDQTSFVYRYPINRVGAPSADPDQIISLRAFARHMSALLEDIDTVNFALNNETGQVQDAMSESIQNALMIE
jgi:hypothetical protein